MLAVATKVAECYNGWRKLGNGLQCPPDGSKAFTNSILDFRAICFVSDPPRHLQTSMKTLAASLPNLRWTDGCFCSMELYARIVWTVWTGRTSSNLALVALGWQLYSMGFLSSPWALSLHSEVCRVFEEMFDEHGDTLAWQYAGSQLVHSIKTYKRTAIFQERSRDVLQTISRYYSNTFGDFEKQDGLNLFLGVFRVPVNPINSSQAHIWSFGSDHHLHFPVVRPKSNEFLEWSLSANSDIDENEFCGEAADDEWLEGKAEFAGWLMLKAAERGIKLSRDFDETNFNPRFAGGDVSNCAEANFNMAYRVFELTSLEQLIRSQHKAQIRRPLILDAFEQSPQHKESFMRMFRGSDHSPSPPPTFAPRRKGSAASTFSSLAAGKASIVREDTDKTSQKAFGGEADDAEEETETDALTVAASDLPEGSGFTVLTTDERLSGKSTVAIATREAAEVAMAVVVGEDLDAGDAYSDLLVLEDRNGTAERMKDPLMKFESLLNRNKTSGMELSSNAPKSRRFGISSGLKSPNEVYFSNSVSCPLFPISKADLALYARYASASTSVFEHHNLLRQRKPTVWKLPTPLSRIRKPNARDNSSSPTHRLSFRQKKGEEEQPKQKASSIKRILPSMGRMPPQSPFRKDFSKLGPMFQFKPPLFTVDSTYETELSALSEESIRLYRETVEMRTIMTAKKPLLAAERTDHFDNGLVGGVVASDG